MVDRESESDSPRGCPYLGLASDPSICCSFLTSSHRCFRWPTPKPVDEQQQRDYCLSPSFYECAWFASADGHPDRGQRLYLPTKLAGRLGLVVLILAVGLILLVVRPWSLLLPSTSEAGKIAPTAGPVETSTPAARLPVYPSRAPAAPTNSTPRPATTPSASATARPTTTSGAAPGSAAVKVYTVKEGDNLYSLARTFGTTVDDLVKANNLVNRSSLRVGQTLVIPPASH